VLRGATVIAIDLSPRPFELGGPRGSAIVWCEADLEHPASV
jgi:hypothetical protein